MDFDEVKVPTSNDEWEVLIEAWIEFEELEERGADRDPRRWAADAVSNWRYDEKHTELWDFITRAFEKKMSDKAFGILAAGALEDLLASFGELYIDRIEELARKNPRFNYLLGGVWKNAMKEDLWNRIQRARLNVW